MVQRCQPDSQLEAEGNIRSSSIRADCPFAFWGKEYGESAGAKRFRPVRWDLVPMSGFNQSAIGPGPGVEPSRLEEKKEMLSLGHMVGKVAWRN